MPKISLVINLDSRKPKAEQTGLFGGCIHPDFLDAGVFNKIKFFNGFDIETIVYIDKHEPIPEKTLNYLYELCDIVCIRKHTSEPGFNDWNYQRALRLATGDIICHMDGDMAAFSSGKESVQELIDLLEQHSFVSYPSPNSPYPAYDSTFDYFWASTRFFLCKRESLDLTELDKMQRQYEYCYETYPASRKEHWTEHLLGLHAKYKGKGVYYPKIEYDKLLIWCWDNYDDYILNRLNSQTYDEVKQFVFSKGGIFYPDNLRL